MKERIEEVLDGIKDLLLYKNEKYGNSALQPLNIFYKGESTNSLLIRLDDKLGRVKNNKGEIRVNDILDIVGYCSLLLIDLGVERKDIEVYKD